MKETEGGIFFEGVACRDLAEKFGTPTYVYEAGRICENYRRLHNAFASRWPRFRIYYALKANSNPSVIRLLREEGAGLDCASGAEIELARRLGAKGKEILFSGNYLTDADLRAGLVAKARINLDDSSLLPRLLSLGWPSIVSFRINPGIGKSNVHESDVMAGKLAKFGIPWERAGEAFTVAKQAGIKRFGVHMMTGSCVTDPGYFAQITSRLLDCVGPLAKKLGIHFEFIDIGGGFGIPYKPGEKGLDIEKTACLVTDCFRKKTKEYRMGEPELVVEPGRYLVGDAGFLVGRVHAIKESYKKFVGTDIGMNIFARPVLYGAYHGVFADKSHDACRLSHDEVVTLCGQACENADAWGKNRRLPKLEAGDLLVVENAGAYGYVMSYPYNGRFRAAEVLVEGDKARLIRERETLEDWLRGTSIPSQTG